LEAVGRGDAGVVMAAATLDVAHPVEREQFLLAELCRLVENRLDDIRRRIGESRQVVVALHSEHVVEEEQHLVHGCTVSGHQSLPSGCESPSWRAAFMRTRGLAPGCRRSSMLSTVSLA